MGRGLCISTFYTYLLLARASAGVVRNIEAGDDTSCKSYVHDGLSTVDCSDRGLNELPDQLYYDARVLLLSNNNFHSFPTQLEKFSQLQTLDISGNHLSSPLPYPLGKLKRLEVLNLSNNNYDVWINSGHTYSISKLDLSKNKISEIDEQAFSRMPNLYFIDLSENRIYNLKSNVFSVANNLNTLVLSRNYFFEIPYFQSTSLRSLYLSNCQITNLNANSLIGMKSLLEIDLSMNQIESLPDNLASTTLQELNLGYNEISSLTDSTFSSLPHLAVLDLRGNAFREVWSTSHFASNLYLREVHVKGNRWSCEGFSVNLLLTYEFLTKDPPKIANSSSLICYSPANVTHMSWQQAYLLTWHPNETSVNEKFSYLALVFGIMLGIILTSFVCRCLINANKTENIRPRTAVDNSMLNLNGTVVPQPRVETVQIRIPLHDEDLPPTYDEALLMPRFRDSFHSLPDFVNEDEELNGQHRRSRSFGDLTETRPRTSDRRSTRRTVEIRID